MAKAKEIAEEYSSSLADLRMNSKPLINMLTMLAEDHLEHAGVIVSAIEKHLAKVASEHKLPVLYLIDSIVKNVGKAYTNLFIQNIVATFCSVFEKVDEKVRSQMFKLRQTWNDVLPAKKLYALDVQIQCIDPAWPITAPSPTPRVYVNPKFLSKNTPTNNAKSSTPAIPKKAPELDLRAQLISKHKELIELEQKKLELELLKTKVKLEEQLLLKPDVPKHLTSDAITPKSTGTFLAKQNQAELQPLRNQISQSGVRIAPVSSSLIGSARQVVRDPRLQNKAALPAQSVDAAVKGPVSMTHPNLNNVNSSIVNSEKSKPSKQKSDLDSSTPNKSLENKGVGPNSTLNIKDPRLSSKPQGRDKTVEESAPTGRSPTKSKAVTSSQKSDRSFRSAKTSGSLKSKIEDASSLSTNAVPVRSSKEDSVSSSESGKSPHPSPSKLKKRSPKKTGSGSKHRKRSRSDSQRAHSAAKFDAEPEDTADSPPVEAPASAVFKKRKSSAKMRNYVPRNRKASVSPEPARDVDLRPAAVPEKQPMLHETSEGIAIAITDSPQQHQDIDLRHLNVGDITGTKRMTNENGEFIPSKKAKEDSFDVLFGNEDVDLRQLPVIVPTAQVERPPTPPPPIISNSGPGASIDPKPTNSHLDALRAKLVSATNLDCSSTLFNSEDRDTDMRFKLTSGLDATEENLNKVFISQTDEQSIKNGNLQPAQYHSLMKQLISLIETQKLREAQRQDSLNDTLQPVSDDELSADFSHSDSEETKNTPSSAVLATPATPVAPIADLVVDADKSKEETSQDPKLSEASKKNESKRPKLLDSRKTVRSEPSEGHPWSSSSSGAASGRSRKRTKTHWDTPRDLPSQPVPEPWIRPPPQLAASQAFGLRRPGLSQVRPSIVEHPTVIPPYVIDSARTSSPPILGSFAARDLPVADPLVLEYIDQDTMKTINIDSVPREIRFYEETAVVMMNWDDPREISFQNGARRVTFDEKDSYILNFNDAYTDVLIGGSPHKIRLGAPTRELYVDGKWYECFFGGSGIGIEIDNKMTVVKVEGPLPQVKIGSVKRTDLCAGKINLIIDAKAMVPVFLDAKPQKFDIEGKVHTLRFVDALRTVLINEIPFKVEFGGLPKPITVHDKKHFIRFSVLPRGVRPGYIGIANMEGERLAGSPGAEVESDSFEVIDLERVQTNEPALPASSRRKGGRSSPEAGLDVLSSALDSSMAPSSALSGYQVGEKEASASGSESQPKKKPQDASTSQNSALPFINNNVNINDLFQKLVSAGIVTSQPDRPREKTRESSIPTVSFNRPETLKIRQAHLIVTLYSGLQCSTCGVRFPPEHSILYSQHLDWHFRQNRRGKNSSKKTLSRRWYYSVNDWKNFEEIEDVEEREKSIFENQTEGVTEEVEEEIDVPSVCADNIRDARCEVCHDPFEQFYNEEKEEWHLRSAIKVEDKIYHPICYEDYQAALLDDSVQIVPIEETKICIDDDDDDDEVVPVVQAVSKVEEPPSVIEDDDEEELARGDAVTNDAPTDEPVKDQTGDNLDLKMDEAENSRDVEELSTGDKIEMPRPGVIFIKQEPADDGYEDAFADNVLIPDTKTDADRAGDSSGGSAPLPPVADTTSAELVSSIDGNVQLSSGPAVPPAGGLGSRIKINITKPIAAAQKESVAPAKEVEPPSPPEPCLPTLLPELVLLSHCNDEPPPPGEEPVQLNVKPALRGLELTKQPPVMKGQELSGLCSIM